MQLSCVSDGGVGQGEVKFDGVQRIKVTVYGALGRKVRDMPSNGLENGRLVVLPATINAFAFNGANGSGGVLAPALPSPSPTARATSASRRTALRRRETTAPGDGAFGHRPQGRWVAVRAP
ncbi:hypothetical protein SUDANB67_05613 (plasmid) [Nocardiopsis dassonvillei]